MTDGFIQQINECLESWRSGTIILENRHVETGLKDCAVYSKSGGYPALEKERWPRDKQGEPLDFVAQLNLLEISNLLKTIQPYADSSQFGGFDLPACFPPAGILMLFVAPAYKSFKAKDRAWYCLTLQSEEDSIASLRQCDGSFAKQPEHLYRPSFIEVLAGDGLSQIDHLIKSSSLDEQQRERLQKKIAAKFCLQKGKQEVLPLCQSRLVRAIAAFHANGISFDEKRLHDSHYKHLVDNASDWVVLWKIAGAPLINFAENRELYICIRKEDLQACDFQKCTAFFL